MNKKRFDEKSALAFSDMLYVIEGSFGIKFNGAFGTIREDGTWKYIPFYFQQFVLELRFILGKIKTNNDDFKVKDYKFIEFGAGIGLKTLYASNFFEKCVGFEYDVELIKEGKILMRNNRYIFEKDILTLTKEDIGESPVVAYYYQPFKDENKAKIFEKLLHELLPVGSFIISHLRRDYTIVSDPKKWIRYNTLSRDIYKKLSA